MLIDWLNCEGEYRNRKRGPAHHRIETFLNEWRYLWHAGSHWGAEQWDSFEEVQKKLSRYKMSPQIDKKRMDKRGMRIVWDAGPTEEAKVMQVITWLGERALLWRVKRCHYQSLEDLIAESEGKKPAPVCCEKWFYARRTDQEYCGSPVCRQRVYASKKKSPEDKAKRAAYMRKYRKILRERDKPSLLNPLA